MYRFFVLIPLLIIGLEGRSQETKHRIYVGLDIFKNIPPLVDKQGYFPSTLIIEPIVRVELAKRLFLNVQAGYSKIGKEVIYTNLTHYRNEGGYLKTGVLYAVTDEDIPGRKRFGISLGLCLTFAHFDESGIAQLKGAFFGDLHKNYSHKGLNVVGVEVPCNLQLRLAHRWKLNFQPRINLLYTLGKKTFLDFPVYYTPGAGNNQMENELLKVPTTDITGGCTMQLFYRLR
ncbi:MAG: hypothetical protein V4714_14910 [Bacteroidota bacterium]